jgi:hypothetical protein
MSLRDAASTGVYLLTGLVWTGRSLLAVAADPVYWDPVSVIDWIAVWAYSLALLLLALTLVTIAADSRSTRAAHLIAGIAATAAAVTGIANGIEDAFNLEAVGPVYVFGALVTAGAMVGLAVALGVTRRPRWMVAVLLMAVGVVTMSVGFGALVLVGAGVATWARRRMTVPSDTQDHSL